MNYMLEYVWTNQHGNHIKNFYLPDIVKEEI